MAANLIGWVLESELPPNPRVQRTLVARCARPGSPLTRHPLGRTGKRRANDPAH